MPNVFDQKEIARQLKQNPEMKALYMQVAAMLIAASDDFFDPFIKRSHVAIMKSWQAKLDKSNDNDFGVNFYSLIEELGKTLKFSESTQEKNPQFDHFLHDIQVILENYIENKSGKKSPDQLESRVSTNLLADTQQQLQKVSNDFKEKVLGIASAADLAETAPVTQRAIPQRPINDIKVQQELYNIAKTMIDLAIQLNAGKAPLDILLKREMRNDLLTKLDKLQNDLSQSWQCKQLFANFKQQFIELIEEKSPKIKELILDRLADFEKLALEANFNELKQQMQQLQQKIDEIAPVKASQAGMTYDQHIDPTGLYHASQHLLILPPHLVESISKNKDQFLRFKMAMALVAKSLRSDQRFILKDDGLLNRAVEKVLSALGASERVPESDAEIYKTFVDRLNVVLNDYSFMSKETSYLIFNYLNEVIKIMEQPGYTAQVQDAVTDLHKKFVEDMDILRSHAKSVPGPATK